MQIDKYKLKLYSFTMELTEELDREKQCLVTTEAEIFETSDVDNHDESFDRVYKAKAKGLSTILQGDKIQKADKKKMSQKLRQGLYSLGVQDYEGFMSWMMATRLENLAIEFLEHNDG